MDFSRTIKPQALLDAAAEKGFALNLRMQPGYDHSYYFIASFIEEHLRFCGGICSKNTIYLNYFVMAHISNS